MLHKYRKTALIEAEQFDGSVDMKKKYHIVDKATFSSVPYHADRWSLPVKDGFVTVWLGDWIATGIDGEHWVIANDIFRKTYERCD